MGLDSVEMLMEVERTFQVTLSDEEAERLETVGDLHAWLCRELGCREPLQPTLDGASARAWTDEEAWRVLILIVSDHLGVPVEVIRPDSHIVHDLGAS